MGCFGRVNCVDFLEVAVEDEFKKELQSIIGLFFRGRSHIAINSKIGEMAFDIGSGDGFDVG